MVHINENTMFDRSQPVRNIYLKSICKSISTRIVHQYNLRGSTHSLTLEQYHWSFETHPFKLSKLCTARRSLQFYKIILYFTLESGALTTNPEDLEDWQVLYTTRLFCIQVMEKILFELLPQALDEFNYDAWTSCLVPVKKAIVRGLPATAESYQW